MDPAARRRLLTLQQHFNVHQRLQQQVAGQTTLNFDREALQRLLEHDNFETRQQMKELTKQAIFVP